MRVEGADGGRGEKRGGKSRGRRADGLGANGRGGKSRGRRADGLGANGRGPGRVKKCHVRNLRKANKFGVYRPLRTLRR